MSATLARQNRAVRSKVNVRPQPTDMTRLKAARGALAGLILVQGSGNDPNPLAVLAQAMAVIVDSLIGEGTGASSSTDPAFAGQ